MLSQERIDFLKEKAKEARKNALTAIYSAGRGHVGGAMSIIEVLVTLYYEVMKVDPQNPKWADRDRLVCSKGHAAPAIYALLAMKGYFDVEILKTLNKNGTTLPSHCDMKKVPGVDMTAGSLGQGLSCAVGIAMANKLDKKDNYVYAIVGDGESQEGQIWEAVMLAAQKKLDNLIVFVDNNKCQVDGYTDNIIAMRPFSKKYEAFGWDVHIAKDGHDFQQLMDCIEASKAVKGQPHVIITDTTKGKCVPGFEGNPACHCFSMSDELFEQTLNTL